MSDSPLNEEQISLQLGDIIEIEAPSDDKLDNKTFFIEYIDLNEINIIADRIKETIKLNDDGSLRNESIVEINIISRAASPGYAQQNNLTPGTWIDIFFSGDVPIVITGKITNLDKDQIEITLLDNQVIYIDFGYKGIPKNLPIEEINIREEPEILKSEEEKKEESVVEEQQQVLGTSEELGELDEPVQDLVPITEAREQMRNMILEADQLQIGVELEEITQIVDVPEAEKRYGIDKQTDDLLDELLSTIPNVQRTQEVLNNIHTMIQRFKQLRSEFSSFDEQNNANKPEMKGANYKPLVETLKKLNKKLYWLLPVARINKKLYDLDKDIETEFSDIVPLTLAESRINETEIINNYLDNNVPSGENKYAYLLRSLQPYLTPYEVPNSQIENQDLTTQRVEHSITAVIDNLEDFYSHVSRPGKDGWSVQRKRFLIQEYCLGQTMLESEKTNKGKIITKNKKVTSNDLITIKSILTLPLPVVNFAHVNLPSTNILLKSNLNLNFLSYWKFLNNNTVAFPKIVDSNLQHNEEDFLRKITEYIPYEQENKYDNFLDTVIPKTRVLFNLIKNKIKGNLSVYDILHYLEPFMIYHKDLSYKQYEEFVGFINEKIRGYKINYVAKKKRLDVLKINSADQISNLIKLLNSEPAISKQILEAYGFKSVPENDGEFFSHILAVDQGNLFNTALAKIALSLMMPDGELQIQGLNNWATETKKEVLTTQSECNKYPKTIAKRYLTIDELEEDNNKEIFYDKRYDKTYYDIIDEYKSELKDFDTSSQIKFLADKLATKNGLEPEVAFQDAEAMVMKKRKVKNGDYAIFEDDTSAETLYFKRTDNMWESDKSINADEFVENDKLFCNLNKSCVFIDKRCEDTSDGLTLLQDDNIEKIVNEFDDNLKKSLEKIRKTISINYELSLSRAYILRDFLLEDKLKYNRKNFDIGGSVEVFDIIKSPYEQLRDAILGQGDLAKRQSDIAKFITSFTRPANIDEDKWWLYCVISDTKLLPTFLQKLSTAFMMSDDYVNTLRNICAEQGTISDDESYWVDKYSGYTITAIDWNTDEGYTESGFKIKSREILEADFGDTMVQNKNVSKRQFNNIESEKVYRVVSAMAGFLGINIDSHADFILQNVTKQLGRRMPSKEKYEKTIAALKAKGKGKETDSYEKAFNQLLIILTLCYLLIAIETSIPPIKTRKSFPGCTKSFSSYPLEGEGPPGPGLVYIACVANKIKSSVEPWNSITKLSQSSIVKKMDLTIKKYILDTEEVKIKMTDKIKYLKTAETEDIPEYLNIQNWINFLPPLRPVKLGTIQNVSDTFEGELKRNIKTGSIKQNEKIDVLRSKIIYFSIKIQELIQKIVSSKSAVLSNSNNSPFLENTCCNDEGRNTLEYFTNINPMILTYNKYATNLENLLYDINTLSEASILFDNKDTKTKYPELSPDFSEETIYRAFIVYCKQNNTVLFDDRLRAVCMGQTDGIPEYDVKDKIEDKIEKLKKSGYNYSNENLQQLMTIINNRHLVYITNYTAINNIERLYSFVTIMEEDDEPHIPKIFSDKLIAMIEPETRLEQLTEQTAEMRELKNYLATANEQMKNSIIQFLKDNSRKTPKKDVIECIENIINFEISGDGIYIDREDETVYKSIQFIKNSMRSMCKVLPNIIINSVDYSKIPEPKHWKLHPRHYKDLQNFVNKYYSKLYQFYNNPQIKVILNKFQEITKNINILAENTPFYAPIKDGEKEINSIFDKRISELLFKYYFYSALTDLISITNETDEIMRETPLEKPTVEESVYLSIEMVESEQNGVIPDKEIVAGNRKKISEKIANLITVFINIICSDKNTINYNYDTLMEKVHRAKEKEKDIITQQFKEMTDEEREIENMFKNNKLEKWSKGLQKGLTIYQKETYDEERETMEKQILSEMKLGNNTDMVTEMNRNIYVMENLEAIAEAEEIEAEELSMNHLPDDDDYGEDMDGDEGY